MASRHFPTGQIARMVIVPRASLPNRWATASGQTLVPLDITEFCGKCSIASIYMSQNGAQLTRGFTIIVGEDFFILNFQATWGRLKLMDSVHEKGKDCHLRPPTLTVPSVLGLKNLPQSCCTWQRFELPPW